MESEKTLTEQESLALITEMIGKARSHFNESGTSAILWGVVVSLCGFVSFAEYYWDFYIGFDIWLLAFIAIVPQIIISIREGRRHTVKTHTQSALDTVWMVYSFSLFALVLYLNIVPAVSAHLLEKYDGITLLKRNIISGSVEATHPIILSASSLFLIIYAFPTICTGIISRFKPMVIGAAICYVLFVASLFTISAYDYLFMGLAGICNWLIPGIILRKRYLRAQHV